MILRLAVRSLTMRPLRTMVLAIGFGLGIAVMAELLGVGEVILEQAHAPALAGGGDILVSGIFGPLESARFVMSSVLGSDRFRRRVRASSPSRASTLYLVDGGSGSAIPVSIHGGIPSREAAIADPEVAGQPSWTNTADDDRWIDPPSGEVLRAMDRFHALPFDSRAIDALAQGTPVDSRRTDAIAQATPAQIEPGHFDDTSWAEWLYFNARSPDGSLRFYLTFLAAGGERSGKRATIVRLQLHRRGVTTNYSAGADVDVAQLLARAPDLDVAGNHVRLDADGKYRITLALARESGGPLHSQSVIRNPESLLRGELILEPTAGRSVPPAAIHGARGWVSGYVVPVLSGTFDGTLRIDGEALPLEAMAGYHDHNWGFWQGVQWQWGQVAGGGISIVYGRVFPPADVADRDRVPGLLGVIGPDGPIAFSTNVAIREEDAGDAPRKIIVESRDRRLRLTLELTVSESVRTPMTLTRGPGGTMTFLQLGGEYRVTGRAGDLDVNFTARGSAETFRPASAVPQSPVP